MDAFVWWGTHAPMWQIYLAMGISAFLLIFLLLPKGHTEESHTDNVRMNSDTVMPGDIIEPTETKTI